MLLEIDVGFMLFVKIKIIMLSLMIYDDIEFIY